MEQVILNRVIAMDSKLLLVSSGLRRACQGCITLSLALYFAPAQALDVVVFTVASHPVSHANGIRIVQLDAPASLEARLSEQLPSDPAQAGALAREHLARDGVSLMRQFATAWEGVTEAWGMGIVKLPAVVVDGRYVVYGDPDVARAVARVNAWRNARP